MTEDGNSVNCEVMTEFGQRVDCDVLTDFRQGVQIDVQREREIESAVCILGGIEREWTESRVCAIEIVDRLSSVMY